LFKSDIDTGGIMYYTEIIFDSDAVRQGFPDRYRFRGRDIPCMHFYSPQKSQNKQKPSNLRCPHGGAFA
jgi:hypothetical protein